MIHHLVDISHRLSLLELSTECVRVVDTLKECLLGALPSSDYQIGALTLYIELLIVLITLWLTLTVY